MEKYSSALISFIVKKERVRNFNCNSLASVDRAPLLFTRYRSVITKYDIVKGGRIEGLIHPIHP